MLRRLPQTSVITSGGASVVLSLPTSSHYVPLFASHTYVSTLPRTPVDNCGGYRKINCNSSFALQCQRRSNAQHYSAPHGDGLRRWCPVPLSADYRSSSILTVRRGPSSISGTSPSMGKGNYFTFYDFPVSPEIDTTLLQKRYHSLQRRVHPDQQQQQGSNTPSAELGGAPSGVSTVLDGNVDGVSKYANEGYAVLKDPFLRCRYLGKLHKAREQKGSGAPISVEEEEALMVETDQTVRDGNVRELDEEFLMEMMAMNELIFAGDRSLEQVRNQMVVLLADLKERNEEMYGIARESWSEGDYATFFHNLHKWTYIWNALKHLRDRI